MRATEPRGRKRGPGRVVAGDILRDDGELVEVVEVFASRNPPIRPGDLGPLRYSIRVRRSNGRMETWRHMRPTDRVEIMRRDGFIFRDENGVERHFMACSKIGTDRERAFMGALRQCRDDWTIEDTRDED